MNTATVHIGIDVAKITLDIAWPDKVQTIENSPKGFRTLIKQCQRMNAPIKICCEASGGYEQNLITALLDAGIAVACVNPRQVRDFAKAQGLRAKTDPLDARLLARFSAAFNPDPMPARSKVQQALRELVDRRDQLLGIRVAELARIDQSAQAFIQRSLRRSIRTLDKLIADCEVQIRELIKGSESLRAAFSRLCLPKGVGPSTAWAVLAYMPELGHLNRKEAAALLGAAPFNHDSGQWRGKRFIQGGRASLRKHLYMAAFVASQHNVILKAFYQRLIEAGKSHKVAVVAVMRKLIILLNRILQDPGFVPA